VLGDRRRGLGTKWKSQKLAPMCSSALSATTSDTPTRDPLLHIMLATHQVRPMCMQQLIQHKARNLQGVDMDVDVLPIRTMFDLCERSYLS
jgi:hypothetical protein